MSTQQVPDEPLRPVDSAAVSEFGKILEAVERMQTEAAARRERRWQTFRRWLVWSVVIVAILAIVRLAQNGEVQP